MKSTDIVAVACDHGGFELKKEILRHLDGRKTKYKDFGTYTAESCDYPDFAKKACDAVVSGECALAILICGTGVGISIAANKIRGVRAACCSDAYSAKYSRLHNNANVLCLGGRVVGGGLACDMTDLFLDSEFEGGRHQRRVDKITTLEGPEK